MRNAYLPLLHIPFKSPHPACSLAENYFFDCAQAYVKTLKGKHGKKFLKLLNTPLNIRDIWDKAQSDPNVQEILEWIFDKDLTAILKYRRADVALLIHTQLKYQATLRSPKETTKTQSNLEIRDSEHKTPAVSDLHTGLENPVSALNNAVCKAIKEYRSVNKDTNSDEYKKAIKLEGLVVQHLNLPQLIFYFLNTGEFSRQSKFFKPMASDCNELKKLIAKYIMQIKPLENQPRHLREKAINILEGRYHNDFHPGPKV
jgi:hypothetical protein